MADPQVPNIIDGFSSVQAVRHSSKTKTGFKSRPSRTTLPALEKGPAEPHAADIKPAARIARSTMPDKFDIVCYECEYHFGMQGMVDDTICPKCHKKLTAENVVIDKECTEPVRTIGIVEITPSGVIKGTEITARNILLAGNAEEGIITAYNVLELSSGARFNVRKTRIFNMVIRKECKIRFDIKVSCNNLTVAGEINGYVDCSGKVVIEESGFLKGKIVGPHLIIKEGGGLKAQLNVGIRRND